VQPIYCGNGPANLGQGHFLGQLNGATLELWCPQCKRYHTVTIVEIVRGTVLDLQDRRGAECNNGKEDK